MNEDHTLVLQQLAARERVDPACLYIEGDVVFRREPGELLRTVCQIGTPYWNAAATAAEVLARFRRR